jgi:hypothetical protein
MRISFVRDVFDWSASDNLVIPSIPILLAVSSKNEMKQSLLQLRSSEVRDVFDMSISDNLMVPASPM